MRSLLRFHHELLRALADTASTTSKWCMLFPKGQFHRGDMPGGSVDIDDAYCATLVANWKKRGEPELPVDYFHRGGSGVAVPNEQKIASGWIQKVEARADGVWGLIKWTDKARAMILADEIRYLSPEWHPNDIDVATGKRQGPTLHGAGLLNDPLFKEMPRVAASDHAVETAPAANPELNMKLILAAALAALSLKDDATEADITARAKVLKDQDAKLTALQTERDAAIRASANVEPLEARITALQTGFDKLTAANAELVAEKKKTAIDGLVNKLQNDGKGNVRIIAAQVDSVRKYASAVGVEEAEKFYMAGPIVLKLGELGHPGTGDGSGETLESATSKLSAAADELVKNGVPRADAMIRAIEQNPELAAAARGTGLPADDDRALS